MLLNKICEGLEIADGRAIWFRQEIREQVRGMSAQMLRDVIHRLDELEPRDSSGRAHPSREDEEADYEYGLV